MRFYRKPLDPAVPLTCFQISALKRLCRLYDHMKGDWVRIGDFYDECGSLALCDTNTFENFIRNCVQYKLIYAKEDNGVIVAVSPVRRPEIVPSYHRKKTVTTAQSTQKDLTVSA